MTRKRAQRNDQKPESQDTENLAVSQGDDGYKVGPGCPPREYQFKPGQSGNPDGSPKHRTHLWCWLCRYMVMTPAELAKLDRKRLTAAQQTALKMTENAVKGKGCRVERLARYIIDREEGRAVERIVFGDGADLSDGECDEVRRMLMARMAPDGDTENHQTTTPVAQADRRE